MSVTEIARTNHLLAALPAETFDRWESQLELVHLPLAKVLYEPGVAQRHVYFPTTAIVTLLHETENGGSGEIARVGCEGLVGVSLLMGGGSTLGRAVALSSGGAVRMQASIFLSEVNQAPQVQQLLLRYTQALITQTAQTALCNRHHRILQQLCLCFLQNLDRVKCSDLVMTHEQIARLLGVRREGVTEAANRLQTLGHIAYHRGRISVIDRMAIEELTCECYGVVKKEFARLLPEFSPVAKHHRHLARAPW